MNTVSAPTIRPPVIVQTAYYVANAEAAARQWAERFGAGPFFVIPNIALKDVVVRGRATTFDHTSAYGWCGDLMIELVQQNCTTPSIFNDRPWGLHHMAHFVEDLPAALAQYQASGLETAMQATTATGTGFAFVDANASHGHYFELYEDNEALTSFYTMVRQAADGWTGTQPIRSL
ncbi:MAG: VOC family protein [Pseudomonadales bacterium]